MHCVTAVDPKWMVELAPRFFTIGNQKLVQKNEIFLQNEKN